jgi:hypothetical protein
VITHNAGGSPTVVTLEGRGLAVANLTIGPPTLTKGEVSFDVVNPENGNAGPSVTVVSFKGAAEARIDTPAVEAGRSVTQSVQVPDSCFSPDCDYSITVDADGQVSETDEGDNTVSGTFVGIRIG